MRIIDAADALGYRSNAVARALVQGRTALVGAIATDLANPYHSEVIGGIERAAGAHGLEVVIGHGQRDPRRITRWVDRMIELNVDGLIVVSSWAEPSALALAAAAAPVVVVGRMPQQARDVDSIVSDDVGGAAMAVRHLIERGHRRIAFVTSSDRPAAMARQLGYETAVAEADANVPHVVSLADDAARALAALLDGRERPTAVLANNDVTAVRVMDAALDRGIRVPDQLAVVGYDNTVMASLVRPTLTTVDQPNDEIGRLAMAMLAERFEGRRVERHVTISPALVVRGSSG